MATDAEVMDACWQVAYHTGRDVRIAVRGGHETGSVIGVGEHWFNWPADMDRFVAWAHALTHREPNAPLPEP